VKKALVIVALAIECMIDLSGLVIGCMYPDARTLIGGSAARLLAMACLGYLALRGRRDWARTVLILLEGGTSLLALVFISMIAMDPKRQNSYGVLAASAIFLIYVGLAIAFAMGLPKNEFAKRGEGEVTV